MPLATVRWFVAAKRSPNTLGTPSSNPAVSHRLSYPSSSISAASSQASTRREVSIQFPRPHTPTDRFFIPPLYQLQRPQSVDSRLVRHTQRPSRRAGNGFICRSGRIRALLHKEGPSQPALEQVRRIRHQYMSPRVVHSHHPLFEEKAHRGRKN